MATDCTEPRLRCPWPGSGSRRWIEAGFSGGALTSDAGALPLGRADRALGLTRRMALCFTDHRDPSRVLHAVSTLVGQRVVGLALGYADLVDHDRLRRDLLSAVLGCAEAGRADRAALAPMPRPGSSGTSPRWWRNCAPVGRKPGSCCAPIPGSAGSRSSPGARRTPSTT